MTRRRRNLVFAGVAGVTALLGAAVVAWAGIPDGSGAIHACYDRSNGLVRVVDPDLTECTRRAGHRMGRAGTRRGAGTAG